MDIIPESSILTQEKSHTDERFLMTYSEDEKQKHEIDSANAKLVFTPEFIPYRLDIKKKFNLNHVETLIYGFIRFYKSNSSSRFFFTNKQIAEIVDVSEPTAARALQNLAKKEVIQVGFKLKAGGGTIRFINSLSLNSENSDYAKMISRTNQKRLANKNKIKENNIYNNVTKKITEKENYYGEELAKILKDERSLTFYKLCAARHDPQLLIQKAREIVSDGTAHNPAAVFNAWIQHVNT